MAHWAQLDENSKVIQVTVGSNDDPDEGYQWLVDNIGGTWIKTSYNTIKGQHLTGGIPLRKNYACIGYFYDAIRDAFIPPKPFDSWVLDEETCIWEPPVPLPNSEETFIWNEDSQSWQQVL